MYTEMQPGSSFPDHGASHHSRYSTQDTRFFVNKDAAKNFVLKTLLEQKFFLSYSDLVIGGGL